MLPVAAAQWTLPLFTSSPTSVLSAANQASYPEGADAIVLSYDVQIRLSADGRMQRTARAVTRILRVQAVKDFQTLSTPWNTIREERPRLTARVITRDGQSHLLSESEIHEKNIPTSVEGISSSTKDVSAHLSDADVDSVVETEVDTSDRKPALTAGRFGTIQIPSKFPIASLSISVSAPADAPLQVQVRSLPSGKRHESTQTGTHQVTIEALNVMPSAPLALAPPEIATQPMVEFSTVASWQAVAAAYGAAVSKVVPSPTASTAPSRTQADLIAEALAQVHSQIQFNGLRWGLGPYVPGTAEEIVKSKVGDPGEETILLLTELAKRGIHAVPALLTPSPASEVLPELPGLEAFESVVVYVPGKAPIWIDPSADTEISRLPAADQGRWALICDVSTTALTKTPEETAEGNRSRDTTTIQLQDGAQPLVVREIETQGAIDEVLRSVLQRLNGSEKNDAKDQAGRMFGIPHVESYQTSDAKDVLRPSHLKLVGEGYPASQLTDDGGFINLPGTAALNLGRFADLLRLASFTRDRVHTQLPPRDPDYFLGPPLTEELHYHVSPPPGYRFKQPDPLPRIDLGPVELTSSLKLEGDGSISLSHTLIVPKRRFSHAEATAICDGLVKILNDKIVPLTLINIGQEQLSRGQFREGLLSLRQSAASIPANSTRTLRLATAYIEVGSRVDAEKICKEVIAKDAKNAEAYARLGWVYTHDEFGRAFEPGMDFVAAEDAMRKALDLEPRSNAFHLNLANLYAHNDAGVVCGPGARLSDAIEEFDRAGLQYLASAGALNEYAAVLLCAKRFDALRDLFLYNEADQIEPGFKIAAIAASQGAQAAIQELDLSSPANSKSTMLIASARLLVAAREYKTAVNLMDALGPKATSQSGLTRLRRTTAWDGRSPNDTAGPILAVKQFIAAVVSAGDLQSWKKTVAESAEFDLNRSRHLLLKLLEPEQASLMQLPGWLNIAADELTTSFQFSAKRDEASGYQVFISDLGGKPRPLATVVKRGNDYVVRSLDIDPTPGLLESASDDVKSLLEQGDLAQALRIEEKRCADAHSSAADWLLRAWLGLLTNSDASQVKEAAEHALELTHSDNANAIDTAALAEADAGDLKEALLNGRKLADGWGTRDQAALVFGRVTEALNLTAALQFYEEIPKPATAEQISSYAFAQKRLAALLPRH